MLGNKTRSPSFEKRPAKFSFTSSFERFMVRELHMAVTTSQQSDLAVLKLGSYV